MTTANQVPKTRNPYYQSKVAHVVVTVGAETGGNTRNVSIQLKDIAYNDLNVSAAIECYLSDNSDGSSIAASAPSGGVAIGTDGLILPVITGKYFRMISEADGDIDFNIIEASTKTFYLVVILPDNTLQITTVAFA